MAHTPIVLPLFMVSSSDASAEKHRNSEQEQPGSICLSIALQTIKHGIIKPPEAVLPLPSQKPGRMALRIDFFSRIFQFFCQTAALCKIIIHVHHVLIAERDGKSPGVGHLVVPKVIAI